MGSGELPINLLVMTIKRIDWAKFCIHAFFGAVLGAIVGLTFTFFLGFIFNLNEGYMMIFGAFVYALVAGFKTDDFWSELK